MLGSEIYRGSSYGGWHPLRVPRVSTVMDLTRAMGWLPRHAYQTSPRARPKALYAWHSPDYIAALQEAENTGWLPAERARRHGLATPSNPIFAEMFRRPATGVGACLLAAEKLAAPGVIYAPGGGTHHGMPDRANGFCFLNDCVFALQGLRRSGLRRIAYIDIDAHHPDGVAHAFGTDPDILMVSVHEAGRWPRTGHIDEVGAGTQVNLPVPEGLNDSEFAQILSGLILPVVDAFAPEAIVLQCGADAVQEDPQSRLALSNSAHFSTVAALGAVTDRYLVLGGGGYNPWSVGRLWSGVWATLIGADIPDLLPTPAQEVLRALEWQRNGRAFKPPPAWITTLRDVPRPGPVRPKLAADLAYLRARALVSVAAARA